MYEASNFWYANPMSIDEAKLLASSAQKSRGENLKQGLNDKSEYEVIELVTAFWQNKDINRCYSLLLKTCNSPKTRALLELVFGQLLMSRKLQPAMIHLQAGLQGLSPYLDSADYLMLMRRHDLLANLHLSNTPHPPANLSELENEARVIKKLKGKQRIKLDSDSNDTVG